METVPPTQWSVQSKKGSREENRGAVEAGKNLIIGKKKCKNQKISDRRVPSQYQKVFWHVTGSRKELEAFGFAIIGDAEKRDR